MIHLIRQPAAALYPVILFPVTLVCFRSIFFGVGELIGGKKLERMKQTLVAQHIVGRPARFDYRGLMIPEKPLKFHCL